MTTEEFLRPLQLHVFEYGIPQLILSDLGSSIVTGSNLIKNFLQDPNVEAYFKKNNIRPTKFDHFYKGCHKLGSLVKTCIKMVKRLIQGAIKNYTIDYRDFEFIISQSIHLVNRRPIALKRL